MPGALFVKHEHLFGLSVSVDHFQVEAHVLAEERLQVGGCVPVVETGDGDQTIDGQIFGFDAITRQQFHLEETSFWVEVHAEN